MNALETAPFRLPAEPAEPEIVAKYFRGLGDPTRLRILQLLDSHGELSVGALIEHLELPQSKVSNHLACLRWCGFAESRREHRIVYYRLADQRVSEIIALAQALLYDNVEHVAACRTIDARC